MIFYNQTHIRNQSQKEQRMCQKSPQRSKKLIIGITAIVSVIILLVAFELFDWVRFNSDRTIEILPPDMIIGIPRDSDIRGLRIARNERVLASYEDRVILTSTQTQTAQWHIRYVLPKGQTRTITPDFDFPIRKIIDGGLNETPSGPYGWVTTITDSGKKNITFRLNISPY